MKIKQQKQIRAFLTETFGSARGEALSDRQEKILDALIAHTEGRSKSQMKTLVQTILPPHRAVSGADAMRSFQGGRVCAYAKLYA